MVLIKTVHEINLMRKAGDILKKTRQMLTSYLKPGISTDELDILANDFIIKQGAISAFKNYNNFPKHICTSVNAVVVHGIPSKQQILNQGDIITIDLGINYKGYYVDSAWTYAIGKIDDDLEKLLYVTQEALNHGLQQVRPGHAISDISRAIEFFIQPYGFGIIKDFTGHGIGKKLHEEPYVPNVLNKTFFEKQILLQTGMTLCIEPMVTVGKDEVEVLLDNWTVITLDRSYSAHFEHTIAVTFTGYEILT